MSQTNFILPNKMPFTNPGSISNSGNAYFTNPESKIYKFNMDILENSDIMSNYLNDLEKQKNNNRNNNLNFTNTNTDANFEDILQQQKNYVKLNKLNVDLPPLISIITDFKL